MSDGVEVDGATREFDPRTRLLVAAAGRPDRRGLFPVPVDTVSSGTVTIPSPDGRDLLATG